MTDFLPERLKERNAPQSNEINPQSCRKRLQKGLIITSLVAIVGAICWNGQREYEGFKGKPLKCPLSKEDYSSLMSHSRTRPNSDILINLLENEVENNRDNGNFKECAAALVHLIPAYTSMADFPRISYDDQLDVKFRAWRTYLDPLIMSAKDGQSFEFPGATLTILSNEPMRSRLSTPVGSKFSYSVRVHPTDEGFNEITYTGQGQTCTTNLGKVSDTPDWYLNKLIENGNEQPQTQNN